MEHQIVLSVYMTVEADAREDAFEKAEQVTEELFGRGVAELDKRSDFAVVDWFCDWTQA